MEGDRELGCTLESVSTAILSDWATIPAPSKDMDFHVLLPLTEPDYAGVRHARTAILFE